MQATSDSLRAALDSVFASPAYDWRERPDPLGFLRQMWQAVLDWLTALQGDNPEAFRLLFWGLVAVLVAILLHAGWVVYRTIRGAGAQEGSAAPRPAAAVRDTAWYRREADRLAAAGRLVEAMQADFLALVLEFDARRLVRFHPSKTPLEYAAEAAVGDPARAELRGLVRTLYRHAFAGAPVSVTDAAAWRARTAPERYAAPH